MQKILIIKHGSLGDIVSSTSAIKPIRDHYKNSLITLLTSKNYVSFFSNSHIFNSVLQDDRKGFFNFIKVIYLIYRAKFNLIIDLQNSNRTFFYCFLLRLFSSVKINSTNYFAHYRYKYDKNNPPHVIKGLSNQIKMLGINSLTKPYLTWMKNTKFELKELKNKDYFIINPGCSSKNLVKRWSAKKYSEVCIFLISKKIIPVVIGTNQDAEIINEIQKYEKGILNLLNKSSLEVIYNLAFMAKGALSNDTGPAHLIASTKCKIHLVLSSFSNTKTVIPQSDNVTFTQSNLISEISSETVISEIKKIL